MTKFSFSYFASVVQEYKRQGVVQGDGLFICEQYVVMLCVFCQINCSQCFQCGLLGIG